MSYGKPQRNFWLIYSQIVAHFLLILGVPILVVYFFYVEAGIYETGIYRGGNVKRREYTEVGM